RCASCSTSWTRTTSSATSASTRPSAAACSRTRSAAPTGSTAAARSWSSACTAAAASAAWAGATAVPAATAVAPAATCARGARACSSSDDLTAVRALRYLYRVPLLLWHVVVDLPVAVLLMALGNERIEQAMVRMWSAGLMRVFGFRLRRIGTPLPGVAMFVANHVSWVDIVALHSQRMMGFVAKREIAGWPLVGWMAARAGTIFHQRGNTESLGDVLQAMLARLRRGGAVGVFPEGRTRRGDEV